MFLSTKLWLKMSLLAWCLQGCPAFRTRQFCCKSAKGFFAVMLKPRGHKGLAPEIWPRP